MHQPEDPVPGGGPQVSGDRHGCKWYTTDGVHSSVDANIIATGTGCEYSGPCVLRSFRTGPVIPWEAFQTVRKGRLALREAHRGAVVEDLAKLYKHYAKGDNAGSTAANSNSISGACTIDVNSPVKSIGKFFEDELPELCSKRGETLYRGATFLMLGILTGNIALAECCLEWGTDPNEMSFLSEPFAIMDQMRHGYSPMFVAVLTGNIDMMDLLHNSGGSLIVYDRWGRTPLHAALAMADEKVIQWLVEKGAPRCLGSSAPVLHGVTTFPELSPLNLALNPRPGGGSRRCVDLSRRGEADANDSKEEGAEKAPLCHCRSGLPRCYCGCIDDMFLRWSYDRLRSRWRPCVASMDIVADLSKGLTESGMV